MATESQPQPRPSAATTTAKRHRLLFDQPPDFFDSCALLPSPHSSAPSPSTDPSQNDAALDPDPDSVADGAQNAVVAARLTCNTCKSEFESLQDQRSHFKSDVHRFNVKLSMAGKSTVKEDDFDELNSDSFKDYDVSSISGSEDEAEKEGFPYPRKGSNENSKHKLFVRLRTGERVWVWKCLVMNETEDVLFENDRKAVFFDDDDGGAALRLRERDVVERLKSLVCEPRDNARLRVVLLASGGHFAGCVFDGNSVVAHKTFHRYVVRAKAGKKQSSKDASGRAAHSAGASLRRYNELALKKEIQELLAAWKPYFDASSCVYIYAPSSSRQLLFDGGKPFFSNLHCAVRNIPLMVRRPTLKEARRLYEQLTQVSQTPDEKEIPLPTEDETLFSESTPNNGSLTVCKEIMVENSDSKDNSKDGPSIKAPNEASVPSESESGAIYSLTPLHEAAQSNNAGKVLELLEMGLDPCAEDERGRTPYMLASEKEVRNTFRRFMALNLDKWDWHAAKVPSALTKEMEESQAAKQAEKDAKKKAKAKELKKLRKAKEKKAQAEATASQNASKVAQNQGTSSSVKGQSQPSSILRLSKEEELKRSQAAEREKRAAAAERRMAAANNAQSSSGTSSISRTESGLAGDIICSCCNVSLAGKVPFHRYNYKYCSTSCMHVHREMLEDGL